MRYALLIPARNEAEALPALLERVRVTAGDDLAQIVVVDNDPSTGAEAVLREKHPDVRVRSQRLSRWRFSFR